MSPFRRRLRSVTLCVASVLCLLITATPDAFAGVHGSPGAGDSYYAFDGNGGYLVSDYHVAIRYDPVTKNLQGDATITATATEDLDQFDLDLNGLTVRSVLVNGQPATKFSRAEEHELVIVPAGDLRSGHQFTVRVAYDGTPTAIKDELGDNGWQISASGGAFAAGEPHSASTWYPVNDTPKDRATFHLAATVPPGWSVIGNGRQGPTTVADGWSTFRWDENTPLISYLTTVAIDKWTFERSSLADGTPVVNAYAPGAEQHKQDEARLPEIIDFLSSKFGKYPQDAAGGIFLADNTGFSLETQTRPTYGQWARLGTIVHENAHQWYGDSVSVENWRDICLNECFASYATWLWDEAKSHADLDQRYRDQIAKLKNEPDFWAGKLYDMGPGKEFTAVYTKGPMALHALREQIGEQAFNQVLKLWPQMHRNGNASWPEFERFVQDISGQDLSGFFQAWFHGTTIPADKYLWPGTLHP